MISRRTTGARGIVLCAALVLVAWPRVAGAQRVEVTECEERPDAREELLDALRLELLGSEDAGLEVHITLSCGDEIAVVTVEGAASGVRVERRARLTDTPAHLRGRLVAMVARELLVAARSLAGAGSVEAPPEAIEEASPEAIEEVQASEPAADAVAASAPPEAPPSPAPAEPPGEVPAPAPEVSTPAWPAVELEASGGARAYVLDAPSVLGTAQVGWRWEWLAGTVSFEGGSRTTRFATIDVLAATVSIGAYPLVAHGGPLRFSLGVFAEGGVAVTSVGARLSGYTGSTEVSPLLGGFLRLHGTWRVDRAVALTAGVDAGYHHGVEVVVLGENALAVDGIFLALRIGAAVFP